MFLLLKMWDAKQWNRKNATYLNLNAAFLEVLSCVWCFQTCNIQVHWSSTSVFHIYTYKNIKTSNVWIERPLKDGLFPINANGFEITCPLWCLCVQKILFGHLLYRLILVKMWWSVSQGRSVLWIHTKPHVPFKYSRWEASLLLLECRSRLGLNLIHIIEFLRRKC